MLMTGTINGLNINQSVSQPASQPARQSINQSVNQSIAIFSCAQKLTESWPT